MDFSVMLWGAEILVPLWYIWAPFHRPCHQSQLAIQWQVQWHSGFWLAMKHCCHGSCDWMASCHGWPVLWNGARMYAWHTFRVWTLFLSLFHCVKILKNNESHMSILYCVYRGIFNNVSEVFILAPFRHLKVLWHICKHSRTPWTFFCILSLGWQDLVTQFLVKITFLYKLVAKKLDFVLSKLQISIWKDRATVAW